MDEADIEALIERSFQNDVAMPEAETVSDSGLGQPTWSFSPVPSLSVDTDDSAARSKDILYCRNYFDLDDILAQTVRVSVKFQRCVAGLGFLDPAWWTGEDEAGQQQATTMAKGTKLELPLWVVKELSGDHAVTVTLPKGYNQVYREILEADANCVNLHKLGPTYYLTGEQLVGMNLAESEDVARSMLNTFTERFHRLFNFALSGSGINVQPDSAKLTGRLRSSRQDSCTGATSIQDETVSELNQFVARLDTWERDLLEVGRAVLTQIKRWECRDLAKIKPNDMVLSLRKRKRLIEQHLQQQGRIASDTTDPVESATPEGSD